MQKLKIGEKILDFPLIQGGMGIGVSLGNLAGSVAQEGCMGTLSMVGIGYREEDYYTNNKEANFRAFSKELKKAREISQGKGMIAVNIMTALRDYRDLAVYAAKEKVDAIVAGAGLPLDLPELVEGTKTLIAPIVSGKRALQMIVRTWEKRYKRYPDFVVIEGGKAGGHLGFKEEDLSKESSLLEEVVQAILPYLRSLEERIQKKIPVFAGGSVFDGCDMKKILDLGCDGVQIGTRFIATEECDVSQAFKETIVNSTREDLKLFMSPVGMTARGINNSFIQRTQKERLPSKRCILCLKPCNPGTTQYCISDALAAAAKGDMENALVFAGDNVERVTEISTVKKVIQEIKKELQSCQ